MIKQILTILGWALIAAGVIGFLAPGLLGMHLSISHDVIHLASGATALWFARSSLRSAKNFAITFGAVYGLLGLAGFMFGNPGPTMIGHAGMTQNLLVVIPGSLELGTADHVIHMILGAAFLVAGFATKPFEVKTRPDTRVAVS